MGQPYLGQLKSFSFGFAPKGWAQCNGQLLPINQNQALFSLLGTTYGGNGQTTFGLPDLRGRVATSAGQTLVLGQIGGQETHTLLISEAPVHQHALQTVNNPSNAGSPGGNLLSQAAASVYGNAANLTPMNGACIGHYGGSQPHENRQPFLTINWCIALQGIFPSRN